jgi:CRISPR/Cas system Type II protein with McrA/HNH and RuvC-like nuclease domain
MYIISGYERKPLSGNIPFLEAYQGNICFYCAMEIDDSDIHVDHVLPRQVIKHDEIWNLVLSHSLCNLHKDDFLVGKHYIEKLTCRNENIMGSNHPWKEKIASTLGLTKKARLKTTLKHYENVRIALNSRYWENSPSYNRETDPFYKRLITVLNNK